ncbi:hypothetical protein DOTSEDRAFT_20426 [Dothistroma septosporum NZE10]|uniref:Uncharacterized protein n=1 Tax=Dothistroma septosporum (strain NZE10 / CBS 128990) TaxID=675120 RepID=N1Q564_DOTSN|nr:hypothetical protein DOTSEDRAFT_20426 [Dothistroma septosporum NZE10]
MPLPENKETVETAEKLVRTLREAFNTPQAYRPGTLMLEAESAKGGFMPTTRAAQLSKAPHFNSESGRVVVRFSSSTAIPNMADTDADANPRGMGIGFTLSDGGHEHTDIIAHSTRLFPVRTGEGFLQLLKGIGGGTIGNISVVR